MELLNGKTAVVTGGTRGIGLAIVRVFLQNGAKVALCGQPDGDSRKGCDCAESRKRRLAPSLALRRI